MIELVLGALASLRNATISLIVCPFVRPAAWNNSASTGRTLMKFDVF